MSPFGGTVTSSTLTSLLFHEAAALLSHPTLAAKVSLAPERVDPNCSEAPAVVQLRGGQPRREGLGVMDSG